MTFSLPSGPVLLLHGGGWSIPDELVDAHLRGLREALSGGWAALERGGTALDAVESAVVVMEDNDAFDAGRGSFLNRDGRVQMDALIMDGATLRAGGVACVERIRNPVRAARRVLEDSPHVYFAGPGAEQFAARHGIELVDNRELVVERELERWRRACQQQDLSPPAEFDSACHTDPAGSREISHDTVGAVALDRSGNIAAATSTGGTLYKAPGRVGDSSLIGCGCYADNESAAVSTTGWGEPIMKLVLGKWAVDRVQAGVCPQTAAEQAIAYLKSRLNGHGGMILLDRTGRFGVAHNTPRMAWGVRTLAGETCAIRRE